MKDHNQSKKRKGRFVEIGAVIGGAVGIALGFTSDSLGSSTGWVSRLALHWVQQSIHVKIMPTKHLCSTSEFD